jgi:hypothetical protein
MLVGFHGPRHEGFAQRREDAKDYRYDTRKARPVKGDK